MVAVFTTSDIVKDIYLKSPWKEILQDLKNVFVDTDMYIPLDEEDPTFILDFAEVDFDSSKSDFIKSLVEKPANVLEEPCGIYLLNISEEQANRIQSEYGVICLSDKNLDHFLLTHLGTSAELKKGEKSEKWKNWTDILRKFQSTPTNSVLVIDAHLFENDYFDERQNPPAYDSQRNIGITNLYNILNQILPNAFSDEGYHVGVLLTDIDVAKDNKRSRTNLTNSRIATAINKLKNKLKRLYPIHIEIIFIPHTDRDAHQLIHNRRIITNSYILEVPYKLAAFNKNNKSTYSQPITVKPLFSLIHLGNDSDTKATRLQYDLNELSQYIINQCNPKLKHKGVLFQNGLLSDSFTTVQHRFLKPSI